MRLISSLPALALGLAAVLSSCGKHSEKSTPTSDNPSDNVRLRFNLKPGSKFSYDAQSVQAIEAGGQNIKQDITMVSSFAVKSAADSATKLDVSYDRVAMKMDAGSQQMTYDSRDPSTKGSPLALMGGLVGKHFTVGVTEAGRVTSVQGVSELVNSLVDPANPNAVAMRTQLSQTLNDKAIKSMMEQSFNIYPNHAVQPGDTWTKVTSVTMGPMTMSATSTYKLNSISDGVAHIGVSSKLDGQGAVSLAGTQTGTMDVDVATGLLADSQLKQTLTGTPAMKIATTIHIKGTKE
ncbi:DUF6263 family protein [Hymenobacter psoromatis]|uniref:DUF6263 family protein n=1 Tax=Hymenobacter psoromatis TaxID=1484116 RepID=UPI001CBA9A8C|nr:DUF6263 family protein [Hymenobacter psoromatis]